MSHPCLSMLHTFGVISRNVKKHNVLYKFGVDIMSSYPIKGNLDREEG